jgi:membrane-bound serine protease (ClpP class)
MKIPHFLLACFALTLLLILPVHAAESGPVALLLTINGAITPATQEYLSRGIQTAEQAGVDIIILQLNTPGGSLDPMQKMAQDIRASTVPVVVYVSPSGAWAASAGTVITLAGHAAAMAPETAIGAASPVGSQGADLPTTEQTKVKEAMKALVPLPWPSPLLRAQKQSLPTKP